MDLVSCWVMEGKLLLLFCENLRWTLSNKAFFVFKVLEFISTIQQRLSLKQMGNPFSTLRGKRSLPTPHVVASLSLKNTLFHVILMSYKRKSLCWSISAIIWLSNRRNQTMMTISCHPILLADQKATIETWCTSRSGCEPSMLSFSD